jgi:predicted O-linked N-acetylglucosamine transferase (SPINDLY family)
MENQVFEQGLAAHRAGQLARAESLYRQVLRADAGHAPALHMLGFLKGQQGQFDEAITLLGKAVKRSSGDIAVLAHYAAAQLAAQQFEPALATYDRILSVQPGHFEALYNRGVILSQLQRFEEALAALDQALAIQPGVVTALYNRAVVLVALERHAEALDYYDQVLAADPRYTPALANRAMVALNLCDWRRVAQISPESVAFTGPPLTLMGYSDDKRLQMQCAIDTVRALPPTQGPVWRGETYRHDRIRLAYVSADFNEHAVAAQLAPLVERHDRTRFQVIGIATGRRDESATRARLVKGFDRFHDFAGLNSDEIARRMREMEIDIAVDLGGHTGLSRLQIFAHRPAPVQVSWLGYPGTTGADFIDYLIGDPVVTPADHQDFFTEKLVQLPDTYFPTDDALPMGAPPSRGDAGLPDDGFVFCCFNGNWKITRPVFDVWMRLLKAVPGSVLWLKQPNEAARHNLTNEAANHGVDAARLVFAKDVSLADHIARHELADLFLDTLPYNAHATAAHALWAGLPVLTLQGDAFAARVSASLLRAAQLPELVTDSLADYEALALRLAREPELLKGYRDRLKNNRAALPLFDGDRLRRNIEAAFLAMHK